MGEAWNQLQKILLNRTRKGDNIPCSDNLPGLGGRAGGWGGGHSVASVGCSWELLGWAMVEAWGLFGGGESGSLQLPSPPLGGPPAPWKGSGKQLPRGGRPGDALPPLLDDCGQAVRSSPIASVTGPTSFSSSKGKKSTTLQNTQMIKKYSNKKPWLDNAVSTQKNPPISLHILICVLKRRMKF